MSTVEIVAITQPLIKTSDNSRNLTANEFVAYAARVSNPGNQLNLETAPNLIKYLAKHKHWSPFQMVSVGMEITTTRDISHQIIRHWSFDDAGNANLQEFSQRYAPVEQFEIRECRLQDPKNRQNSIVSNDAELNTWWDDVQRSTINGTKYYEALEKGIAKEQARALLPEGLTQTRFFIAGTLRAWIHYLQARCEEGVQKEHREIAVKCRDILLEHFPDISGLFEKHPIKNNLICRWATLEGEKKHASVARYEIERGHVWGWNDANTLVFELPLCETSRIWFDQQQ